MLRWWLLLAKAKAIKAQIMKVLIFIKCLEW